MRVARFDWLQDRMVYTAWQRAGVSSADIMTDDPCDPYDPRDYMPTGPWDYF